MNPWLMHVKKFQEQHGCSYKDALKGAKGTYKKGRGLGDIIQNAREKKPLFGGSLSSMNKAYWKANKDLFDYTHKPMIAAATKLYGF